MMQEPVILAVETSSRLGSVAVAHGPEVLAETTFSAPLRHSAEIFPTIASLLDRFGHTPDDIAQIHIAIGPGSFTGLRIAVAMAKAMYLANGAAIITVDSLDAIAANVVDAPSQDPFQNTTEHGAVDRLATVLDAKRGQFYVAVYERTARAARPEHASQPGREGYEIPGLGRHIWRKILPDCLMTAAEIIRGFAGEAALAVSGDGLLYHRDEFGADGVHVLRESCWSPRAAAVHALGYQKMQANRFADPLTLAPFYLRGPQVTVKGAT